MPFLLVQAALIAFLSPLSFIPSFPHPSHPTPPQTATFPGPLPSPLRPHFFHLTPSSPRSLLSCFPRCHLLGLPFMSLLPVPTHPFSPPLTSPLQPALLSLTGSRLPIVLPAPSSLSPSLPLPFLPPCWPLIPPSPVEERGPTSPCTPSPAAVSAPALRWGRRHLAGCWGGSREEAMETMHLL